MSRFLYPLFVFLLLTGCANTRDPQMVSSIQPYDFESDCAQILSEYSANTESAAAKIKKNDKDDVQDAVIGFFIWPGLADFKNADGIEGNALLDRNIRLKNMAIQKNCVFSQSLPDQPVRYD